MRVVAGKLRHRTIEMANLETTRETQDKVRGAIFNMIGPYFDGGTALDLFAGSGAMGIEAYSRGIASIHLNDIEPKAIQVCKKNCQALGIKDVAFTTLDYQAFLSNTSLKWNVIFLDPPYRMNNASEIISYVVPHLVAGGLLVFEMAKETEVSFDDNALELLKDKTYGIKRVLVWKRR